MQYIRAYQLLQKIGTNQLVQRFSVNQLLQSLGANLLLQIHYCILVMSTRNIEFFIVVLPCRIDLQYFIVAVLSYCSIILL